MNPRNRMMIARGAAMLVVWLACGAAHAAPKAELWPRWEKHDPESKQTIGHSAWGVLLKKYVSVPGPDGIHRVNYGAVTAEDRSALKGYLKALQQVPISRHNRIQQMAYWINLYNAVTVDLILSRYPVASIRDINISPGLFSRGPWGAKLIAVENEPLSLDDIEHRILRPVWKDNRVHYAVNCASLGCPNLQPAAYTAAHLESLLEKGAREFVNHPRGLSVAGGKLKASSLYIWFQEDFGGDAAGLLKHWRNYADAALFRALENYSGGIDHDYDWRLNDVPKS